MADKFNMSKIYCLNDIVKNGTAFILLFGMFSHVQALVVMRTIYCSIIKPSHYIFCVKGKAVARVLNDSRRMTIQISIIVSQVPAVFPHLVAAV